MPHVGRQESLRRSSEITPRPRRRACRRGRRDRSGLDFACGQSETVDHDEVKHRALDRIYRNHRSIVYGVTGLGPGCRQCWLAGSAALLGMSRSRARARTVAQSSIPAARDCCQRAGHDRHSAIRDVAKSASVDAQCHARQQPAPQHRRLCA
jgi:hypothetical protein